MPRGAEDKFLFRVGSAHASSHHRACLVAAVLNWSLQVMFVIVAFNIVPAGVPNFINYAVSVVGPAVVVNLLS